MAEGAATWRNPTRSQLREIGVSVGVFLLVLDILLLSAVGFGYTLLINALLIAGSYVAWSIVKTQRVDPLEAKHKERAFERGLMAAAAAVLVLGSILIGTIMLALGAGSHMVGFLPLLLVVPGFFLSLGTLFALRVYSEWKDPGTHLVVDTLIAAVSVIWAVNMAYSVVQGSL